MGRSGDQDSRRNLEDSRPGRELSRCEVRLSFSGGHRPPHLTSRVSTEFRAHDLLKITISSIAAICLVLACASLPDAPVTESTAADFGESPTRVSVTPTAPAITGTTNPPAAVATAMPSPTPILLQVIVPPCIPFPGSAVDPCERRDWWEDFTPHIKTAFRLPEVVSTLREFLLNRAENPDWALHFAVRATAVPGSVRCSPTDCYVDLAVNEYLFGKGPAVVTATMTDNPSYYAYVPESRFGEQCIEDGAELIRATGIEGVEWLMLLGGPFPYALTKNAWGIGPTYDLQLREDGLPVVVDRYKKQILANSTPENYALNESRLEWTLDDFRQVVSDAFATFVEFTDGRTGTVNDSEGRLPPILATDAGPAGFNDFLIRTGLIGDLQQAPPPIPDDGRQNPDRLRINDVIATRVTGGSAE